MKDWKPKDVVAVLLALAVVIFVGGDMLKVVINPEVMTEGEIAMWSDFLKVLIGGLLGYMARGSDK